MMIYMKHRKQDLISHANYLHVKSCFLEKIGKKYSNMSSVVNLPRVLSVKEILSRRQKGSVTKRHIWSNRDQCLYDA